MHRLPKAASGIYAGYGDCYGVCNGDGWLFMPEEDSVYATGYLWCDGYNLKPEKLGIPSAHVMCDASVFVVMRTAGVIHDDLLRFTALTRLSHVYQQRVR